MIFTLICVVLALLVAGTIVAPLLRRPAATAGDPDVAFYKAQLAEVDRDVARDVLAADEAERARAEIARRLLAADAARATGSTGPKSVVLVAAVAGFIVVFGGLVYWQMGAPTYPDLPLQTRIALGNEARESRPSQAQAEAAAPAPPPVEAAPEYLENVEMLREIVPTRPDDLQGWTLLTRHEATLRNYSAAAKAQERVITLKGDEATVGDLVLQVDMMVAAANGFVSPEAEEVVQRILASAPDNIPARYYLGSLYNQTDRPDIAFRLWREIVETGPADLFHVSFARAQIADAAFRAGVDYTLPEVPGPTAEDIENAQDMAPEDRQQMIRGMVAGLADRLATEGGPASDWARLITAYGVLGETETARAIYSEAREVFAASDEALAILEQAAATAGLAP